VVVAGLVVAVSQRQTQRGRMASLQLDDRSGRIEVTLFSDACEAYADLLAEDRVLLVTGNLNHDEYRGGLAIRVDQVMEFEHARVLNATAIHFAIDHSDAEPAEGKGDDCLQALQQLLTAYRGGDCQLRLHYRCNQARAMIALGDEWRVRPTDELLRRLDRLTLSGRVRVKYGAKSGAPSR
jgi:DNA polymerase-3 subunit alpha